MKLLRLRLENYGVFGSESIIDFDTDSTTGKKNDRRIILIGGKNGAGKSTILEAILLALYGPALLGPKPSEDEYRNFILRRMHSDASGVFRAQRAMISLKFEYGYQSQTEIYEVTRTWLANGSSISERLSILRDGKRIDDLEVEYWQDFLEELVPPGLSNLFLFDGERISELADGDEPTTHFVESLRSLLGIELIERLQRDLHIYAARMLKPSENVIDPTSVQVELDRLENDLERKRWIRADLASRLDAIKGRIERVESAISQEGGRYAERRSELKARLHDIEKQLSVLEGQIREMASRELPFAVAPSLTSRLKHKLDEEHALMQRAQARTYMTSKVPEIVELLKNELGNQLNISPKVLYKAIESVIGVHQDNTALVHVHGLAHYPNLIALISSALNDVPPRCRALKEAYDRLVEERQKVEVALNRIPRDEVLQPLLSQLQQLQDERVSIEVSLARVEAEVNSLESEKERLNKQLVQIREALRREGRRQEKLDLVHRTLRVLENYTAIRKSKQLKELEDAARMLFTRLCRKADLVGSFEIDPETFKVTLRRPSGEVLHKRDLSYGEKQLYALSLLWAIMMVSKRRLPVVIDTPLGRLDSEHRMNIAAHYFPAASHQVVLLSTDTEIDKALLDVLEPFVAKCYHLVYDPASHETRVEQGYFWGENALHASEQG